KAELLQLVERTIDLQRRAEALVPQPIEDRVGAERRVGFVQRLEHERLVARKLPVRGHLCPPVRASAAGRRPGARTRLKRKRRSAATTTEGPEGVSKRSEAESPPTTASAPVSEAITAIVSGVAAKRRPAAAGMMRSAVIRSTPTIFMAMAM